MIYIIERQAHVLMGHEHTQMAAIRALAPEIAVDLIGGIQDNNDDPSSILMPRRQIRKKGTDRSLVHDVDAICRYVERKQGDQTVFVIPSAVAYELRLALRLKRRLGNKARIATRLLRPEHIGELGEEELEELRQAIRERHISVHTETRELQSFVERHLNIEATDDFLLPATVGPDDVPNQRQSRSPNAPFRVGFLGLPRKDKGSELVPDIISALKGRSASTDRQIVFTLQRPKMSGLKLSPRKYVWACNRAARSAPKASIDWITKPQLGNAFVDLLAQQDLLLLPYRLDAYAHRGSGIVIDGILAGVPILHTKGIGMQHLLRHTGVAAESADGFAQKIAELCTSPCRSAEAILAARQATREQLARTHDLFLRLSDLATA